MLVFASLALRGQRIDSSDSAYCKTKLSSAGRANREYELPIVANPTVNDSVIGSARSVLNEREILIQLRALADNAFSRASGAPLISGNQVDLLKDAQENYPAWLGAIAAARNHIHFESYIIHDDAMGRQFAEALIAKACEGVRVRVIYDWLGGFGRASRRLDRK